MPTILVFGSDPLLVETRRRVLERAGLDTITTTELPELGLLIEAHQPSLLILCSSLDESARKRGLDTARRLNPAMRTLVVVVYPHYMDNLDDSVVPFPCLDSPERFLMTVKEIIASHPQSRLASPPPTSRMLH